MLFTIGYIIMFAVLYSTVLFSLILLGILCVKEKSIKEALFIFQNLALGNYHYDYHAGSIYWSLILVFIFSATITAPLLYW